MDILSLDTHAREIGGQLPPIAVMGGGMIKPEGFVIMNVRVPLCQRVQRRPDRHCVGRS